MISTLSGALGLGESPQVETSTQGLPEHYFLLTRQGHAGSPEQRRWRRGVGGRWEPAGRQSPVPPPSPAFFASLGGQQDGETGDSIVPLLGTAPGCGRHSSLNFSMFCLAPGGAVMALPVNSFQARHERYLWLMLTVRPGPAELGPGG